MKKNLSVPIKVHLETRPRIPLVVAFPTDVVRFTVDGGEALVFIPGGEGIFDNFNGNAFSVPADGFELTVSEDVFNNASWLNPESHGALVVKYAIHCMKDGETYFAEGNSAPRIIIPKP
jgi:hypothetical protein